MATTFFTSAGNSADSRAEPTGVTRSGAPLARASRLPLLDLFPDVHVGVVLGGRGDLVPLEDQCARLER